MIRLPPTVIAITIGEVQDYEKRPQKGAKAALGNSLLQVIRPSTVEEDSSNETKLNPSVATAPQSPLRSRACSPALLVERIDNLRLQTDSPEATLKSPEQLIPAWYGMDGHGYDPGEPSNISPVFEDTSHPLSRRLRQMQLPASDIESARTRGTHAVTSHYGARSQGGASNAVPGCHRDLFRRPGTPYRSSARPVPIESHTDLSQGSMTQARAYPSSYRSNSCESEDRTPSRLPIQTTPVRPIGSVRDRRLRSFSANSTPKLRGLPGRSMEPSTPALQVYNDSLPPETQPQTPFHLPESRHRSRAVAALTAPVGRVRSRTVDDTPAAGRSHSPAGMLEHGFIGLYGGMENGDDLLLFREGERRLGTGRRE